MLFVVVCFCLFVLLYKSVHVATLNTFKLYGLVHFEMHSTIAFKWHTVPGIGSNMKPGQEESLHNIHLTTTHLGALMCAPLSRPAKKMINCRPLCWETVCLPAAAVVLCLLWHSGSGCFLMEMGTLAGSVPEMLIITLAGATVLDSCRCTHLLTCSDFAAVNGIFGHNEKGRETSSGSILDWF